MKKHFWASRGDSPGHIFLLKMLWHLDLYAVAQKILSPKSKINLLFLWFLLRSIVMKRINTAQYKSASLTKYCLLNLQSFTVGFSFWVLVISFLQFCTEWCKLRDAGSEMRLIYCRSWHTFRILYLQILSNKLEQTLYILYDLYMQYTLYYVAILEF